MDEETFDQLTRCRGCFFRNSHFEPKFCFERFVLLAQFGAKYPALAQARMVDIINTGLMSFESQGNYDLYFPLWKEKSPLPLVDGKKAFFALREDAQVAARQIKRNLRLGIDVAKLGRDYAIPEVITPRDWAVMRLKVFPEKELKLLEKLAERGVLSTNRSGNYSVLVSYTYRSGDRSTPSTKDISLFGNSGKYYFVHESDAQQYLQGICHSAIGARIERHKSNFS